MRKFLGIASLLALSLVEVACSPKTVTTMRETWEQYSTKVHSVDEEGMRLKIEDQKNDLNRSIREIEVVREVIRESDPIAAAELSSKLETLTARRRLAIEALESEHRDKLKFLVAALEKLDAREELAAEQAAMDRLVVKTALQGRLSKTESSLAQNKAKRVVSEFLLAVATKDSSEVRRLLSTEAQGELSERRLQMLRESLPNDPTMSMTRLSSDLAMVTLAGRDGRQATIRLRTRDGNVAIDDVKLPVSL